MKYFFDSYAILEIINGNNNYSKFKDEVIVSSSLNLAEVFYALLTKFGEDCSINIVKKLDLIILDITTEIAIEASKYRFKHKKSDLSYADCIGYTLALKHNIKFLTGDKEFKDLPHVEFVK
ncbi:MAG: PIN domain-containing protein [Nanoarchaeota archaeon]